MRRKPKQNPVRTPLFRMVAIASAGTSSFLLALWGFQHSFGSGLAGLSASTLGSIIAALCTLAAAGAVISFFAGVDESVDYVISETQVDKLTGFNTRAAMIGRIAEAVIRATKTGSPLYMIDIEIERFKQINDAIGYAKGDELIRSFGRRLRASLPTGCEFGRIGAGEFAILVPDKAITADIEAFLERIAAQMVEPYGISGHTQTLGVAMGVVAIPKDGSDPVLLLRRSNLALQNARASGKGAWALFQDEMGVVAQYRQWIESELRPAFERGDFDLHYQPQLDLASNRVVGYEALIRWRHPERGMIPPGEFIPVAEETGMIVEIGDWVLRKACRDCIRLPEDCFVAVNISPVQFMARDFTRKVHAIMAETGFPAHRLEIEVTETAMMQDRAKAAEILDEITAMGISIAVDDFGTGYSNLSYLIDFRFNKLKIDRSFVSRLDRDTSSGAVVSTIVGLSRALGVHTIAEGVETQDQAILLRAAGCDVVQGYYYGKPEPLQLSGEEKAPAAAKAVH